MAVHAYILITVDPARTQTVGDKLRALPGTYVREVLGPYDFVVELEADTQENLTAILRTKIRPVPGVTSTVTCPWIE
ncbi:MAG: Lrp/AsnC family transcriptional regulator [Dehalococcoidia bacterium]|nr:Lrp/AsnC family transcriptional regulator [Dehalococcoidia bacterium]